MEEDLRKMNIMRLASEDPRSTGLKDDCAGGQVPYWNAVPDFCVRDQFSTFSFLSQFSL
jgi:hypothetical protein